MNKIIFALATSLISSMTFAAMNVEMRGDWDQTDYSNSSDTAAMVLSQAQLTWAGPVDENLDFKVRLKLNDEKNVTGPDGVASRVEYANIRALEGPWSLTMGKFHTEIGGFETNGPSEDLYFRSEASLALNKEWKDPTQTTINYSSPLKFQTGLRVGYKNEASELAVLATNNPEAEAAAAPKPQTRLMTGAIARVKAFDSGTFLLSFHQVPRSLDQTMALPSASLQTSALGFQWKGAPWLIEADFISATSGPQQAATDERKASLQTAVVMTAYNIDSWTSRIKLEQSTMKITSSLLSEDKRLTGGSGLILEYQARPKTLRYQAALTQKSSSLNSAAYQSETHLMVGFTFKTDLFANK